MGQLGVKRWCAQGGTEEAYEEMHAVCKVVASTYYAKIRAVVACCNAGGGVRLDTIWEWGLN